VGGVVTAAGDAMAGAEVWAMAGRRPRVLVIGGGFGGLSATRALASADVDVTLVDRTNHHLFQPLLYQVATGILPPGLIAPALRHVVRGQPNVQVLLAEAEDVDLDRRVVSVMKPHGRSDELPYDSLVVAAGATHSYFGRDQFARFAPGMKTIEDARYLRDGILSSFEMAELASDAQERAEWLTFVVVGAGPTGVELIGQIAELAHNVLPRDFRHVDTSEARIVLLEGASSVLPMFPAKLQRYTQRQLEEMGVEIRLNTLAVEMDHDSVTVQASDGCETIRTRTRIWAAGVRASSLAALLAGKIGLETDRAGRLPVGPDCTLAGYPEVFAIGDMVSLNGLPSVAQPAMQEGKYVGTLIRARLAGQASPGPFRYSNRGSMATIGHRRAVAESAGVKLTGLLAYLAWGFVHVMYLIGWGNRLGTIYTWASALYLSKSRSHRIISFETAGYEIAGQRTLSRAVQPHSYSPSDESM
jgi:NADH:ubiquinone reductase (H+-translocating)